MILDRQFEACNSSSLRVILLTQFVGYGGKNTADAYIQKPPKLFIELKVRRSRLASITGRELTTM